MKLKGNFSIWKLYLRKFKLKSRREREFFSNWITKNGDVGFSLLDQQRTSVRSKTLFVVDKVISSEFFFDRLFIKFLIDFIKDKKNKLLCQVLSALCWKRSIYPKLAYFNGIFDFFGWKLFKFNNLKKKISFNSMTALNWYMNYWFGINFFLHYFNLS